MARYFTKAELESLAKQLAAFGVKDTELEEVVVLTPDDKVAIVQGGVNKLVSIKTLTGSVSPLQPDGVKGIRIISGSGETTVSKDDDGTIPLKLGDSLSYTDSLNITWN